MSTHKRTNNRKMTLSDARGRTIRKYTIHKHRRRHLSASELTSDASKFDCRLKTFFVLYQQKKNRKEKREENDSTSLAAALMTMFSSAELLSYASFSGEGVVVPKQSCERREKFIVFKLPFFGEGNELKSSKTPDFMPSSRNNKIGNVENISFMRMSRAQHR